MTGVLNGYTVVYLAYLQLGSGVQGWPTIGQGLAALTRQPAQVGEGAGVPTNAVLLESLGLAAPNVVVECVDAGSSEARITPGYFLASADVAVDLAPTFAPALVSGPPSYDGANGAACAQWPTQDESSDWEATSAPREPPRSWWSGRPTTRRRRTRGRSAWPRPSTTPPC